jgi:hypothetical protein
MDYVTIKTQAKDEIVPHYYTVTGGTFSEMKDAIKAAGARFDGQDKAWRISRGDLSQITEQFSVEEELPIRFEMEDRATSGNFPTHYDGSFKFRSPHPNGWERLSVLVVTSVEPLALNENGILNIRQIAINIRRALFQAWRDNAPDTFTQKAYSAAIKAVADPHMHGKRLVFEVD